MLIDTADKASSNMEENFWAADFDWQDKMFLNNHKTENTCFYISGIQTFQSLIYTI
jgi:hypothetical protein